MNNNAQLTPPRRRRLHFDRLKRLVGRALGEGARRVSAMVIEWDRHGDCSRPKEYELYSLPEADHGRFFQVMAWKRHPFLLRLTVSCRRCDRCRDRRRRAWSVRAKLETEQAVRTWFGTLTLRPEAQHRFLNIARKRLADRAGLDFEALPVGEQFGLRHAEISRELTKYLKRVRKESGAPLRYLLVCEQHKSFEPHYHALVHEVSMLSPVRHSTLSKNWPFGFTQWKLITETVQATYLCKYLAKSTAARVRASVRYGEIRSNNIPELYSGWKMTSPNLHE